MINSWVSMRRADAFAKFILSCILAYFLECLSQAKNRIHDQAVKLIQVQSNHYS